MMSGDQQRLENSDRLIAAEGTAVNDQVVIVNDGPIRGMTRAVLLHDGAAPVVHNNGLP